MIVYELFRGSLDSCSAASINKRIKQGRRDEGNALPRWLFVLLVLLLVLPGCEPQTPSESKSPATHTDAHPQVPVADPDQAVTTERSILDAIAQRKVLRVITRNAPSSYFLGRAGPEGPEADMVNAFAASLGVSVEFIVLEDVTEMLSALQAGEADLVAAGLARTKPREQDFAFGPGYQHVTQQVICRRGGPSVNNVDDLLHVTLAVGEGSNYDEKLQQIAFLLPELVWARVSEASTEDLLRDVWLQHIDCTVADSNIFALNQRFYPELRAMFDLTEAEELAWVLPKDAMDLRSALEEWFEGYWASGGVSQLMARYYGHTGDFDYVDSRRFLGRARNRLPHYRPLFEQAARDNGLDWTLLAALSYQESHWDVKARSETGVRGLMMLTRDTASELGVQDRTDPNQAIAAGAQYLASLIGRLPDAIQEPDRTWMALAAYNMGMSHLYDVRRLVKSLGQDPDVWEAIRAALPLLAKREYYRDLPGGYARGHEARDYVDRVRHYQEMLKTIMDLKVYQGTAG